MSQQIPPEYVDWDQLQQPPEKPAKKRAGIFSVIFTLLLILAALVILNESVLRIRKVAVVGNRKVDWETVVVAAGLNRSTGYFFVNETKIAEGINANRYLIFEKLEKVFPNTLTIYVRERAPVAKVAEMGAVYHLDEEGMVLEKYNTFNSDAQDESYDGLIVISGLKPKEMRVGRKMVAGSAAHGEAYLQLIRELTLQGYLSEVSELNVNDPENIYLTTRDGYTARLGDLSSLRAKIGTIRAVVPRLREMGLTGGLLEVTIPGEAVYSRDD
ncbi:MAG: FtsQ-type POTRA domain-containing protein [Clostridia bacterium]|nr:FtsQ-type POTRA domain-containing protein [Clostridia bacterium]